MADHQFREHGIVGQDIALSLLSELGMEVLRLHVLARFLVVSPAVSHQTVGSRHRCKKEFDVHCRRSRHRCKRAGWIRRLEWTEASLLNLHLALGWGLDSVLVCLRGPRSRKAP